MGALSVCAAAVATTRTTTSIAPRRCREGNTQTRLPPTSTNTSTTLRRSTTLPTTTKTPTPTPTPTTTRTRAVFTTHHNYSYEHSHDEQFQRWLHDLVTVVESNTWCAVPALLRFPRAEPEIVLSLAAAAGQAKLVDTILRTCPDAVDPRGAAAAGAAVTAAARGHPNVLATLLNAGLSADAVDLRDTSILLAAAGAADVLPLASKQCTAMLLAAGADANAGSSRKGWKPLMAAAKSGDHDVMRMLLDAGADHEARYPNGKTPLYCAAEWGRLDAVRVLLDAGARPEIPADRLMTDWSKTEDDMKRGVLPAEVAARNGHMAVARVLSEATAATAQAREAEGIAVRFASCQLPPPSRLPPRLDGGGGTVDDSTTEATAGAVELAAEGSPILRPTTNAAIKGENSW